MKKYYIVLANELNGDTPYDAHQGTFESLESAREKLDADWSHTAPAERRNRTEYIAAVEVPDDMDSAAALDYALDNGYEVLEQRPIEPRNSTIAGKLAQLDKEFGTVTFEGHRYILAQQAYSDCLPDEDAYYEALALREDTDVDENGYATQAYMVKWYVPQSTLDYWEECKESGVHIDESDACDWDSPDEVRFIDTAFRLI